jgi:hypothetical protein
MCKGSLVISREYHDGRTEVLVDGENYVLLYPRAYNLFQTYDGRLPNDPIQTYELGSGGFVNGATVAASGTNTSNSVYNPLTCLSETTTTQIYDRTRLTRDAHYVPSVGITSTSPRSVTYSFYLDFEEAVGQAISEAGLKTRANNLFCYKAFPTVVKTSEFKLTFQWKIKI